MVIPFHPSTLFNFPPNLRSVIYLSSPEKALPLHNRRDRITFHLQRCRINLLLWSRRQSNLMQRQRCCLSVIHIILRRRSLNQSLSSLRLTLFNTSFHSLLFASLV